MEQGLSLTGLLFIFSLITCAIGIATFAVGMKRRATNDGVLVQKINQALEGIEELKSDVKSLNTTEHGLELQIQSHEEQIKTIFQTIKASDAQTQALLTLCEVLKDK